MIDINLKEQLKIFIEQLPLANEEKQRLTSLLESEGGVGKAQAEIKSALELARQALQVRLDARQTALTAAQQAFDQAETEFTKGIAEIEAQAKDLAKAISQQQDKEALEDARKKVA